MFWWQRRTTKRAHKGARFKPQVERLEDRTVPSGLVGGGNSVNFWDSSVGGLLLSTGKLTGLPTAGHAGLVQAVLGDGSVK